MMKSVKVVSEKRIELLRLFSLEKRRLIGTHSKCHQVHAAAAKKNYEKLSKSKETKGIQNNSG